MPDNIRTPESYNYSENLLDGRRDLQASCHYLLDKLFSGCTILDVGSGQGKIKERVKNNTVFTHDIDKRLTNLDYTGEVPQEGFDIVTAFDVIEHVRDDLRFLQTLASRAHKAVVISTPNWHVTQCNTAAGGSTHHWREYTAEELITFVSQVYRLGTFLLLAMFKDAQGEWFEFMRPEVPENKTRKYLVIWCEDPRELTRISNWFKNQAQPNRIPD